MMMLDYQLSPSWNRKAGEIDLRAADEMTLRYDCFLGDVLVVIGDVDLSARWGWVPVLDFGLGLRSIAGALAAEKVQTFEFTESDAALVFRREESPIEVSANYAEGTAKVAFVEFSLQVERFVARLVDEFGQAHPELAENVFFAELARRLSLRS
jgi:hypothetical protein